MFAKRLLLNCLVFVFITANFSCDLEKSINAPAAEEPAQYTFRYIEQNVFRPRCASSGCHATDTRRAGLDLSTANAFNNLVNVPSVLSINSLDRVEPGANNSSFLIKVLDGSDPTIMPLNGTPLNTATIEYIKLWIDDGAQNN